MTEISFPFPHTQMDVFHVALEMATRAKALADAIPRGYRSFADQLLRAAGSTVLNIGEGANRYSKGAKRQRYSEARGECGELAACVQMLATMGLIDTLKADDLLLLAGRVGAMLTVLIRRMH